MIFCIRSGWAQKNKSVENEGEHEENRTRNVVPQIFRVAAHNLRTEFFRKAADKFTTSGLGSCVTKTKFGLEFQARSTQTKQHELTTSNRNHQNLTENHIHQNTQQ